MNTKEALHWKKSWDAGLKIPVYELPEKNPKITYQIQKLGIYLTGFFFH